MTRFPTVVAITVGIVAVLTLFSVLEFWKTTTTYNEQQPDPYRIGYQDARFEKAAERIPKDAFVGYVSNLDFGDVRGAAAFFGAQYALAPRLLVSVESPMARSFVIGNFSERLDVGEFVTRYNLVLEEDLGGGVALFRKERGQ